MLVRTAHRIWRAMPALYYYQVPIKQVAQASILCRRRLKPAATKNSSLIATRYERCPSPGTGAGRSSGGHPLWQRRQLPAGRGPERGGRCPRDRAAFSSPRCHACPQRARCPVKPGNHYHYRRYGEKDRRLAQRRARRRAMETGPGSKSRRAQLIFLVKEHMQTFGTTITNFIIPDVSCYPFELKMAA